ncbi:30S ribosomal protein S6e [Candidatus Woesearchaeota archaeon CG10_big_fil_rev_8_21_14_0_10_37_12]|nr:MAG: 30S ribosomal protein S6e [Candidatus Woesearchaeota archaeon CG10_big_fil_rev_8_21_14_0_10_37_12]
MAFKLVIGTKDGKSAQKEVQDPEAKTLLGRKLGEQVKGDDLGFAGYEFLITGGSDHCGFPMRKDLDGTGRKRILAVQGIGLKKKRKGCRVRKTMCGNTIHEKISQINLKVTKEGKESLIAPKETAKAEEKKE